MWSGPIRKIMAKLDEGQLLNYNFLAYLYKL